MKIVLRFLFLLVLLLAVSGIGGYFYFRRQFQAPPNQLVVTGLPATFPLVWEAGPAARPRAALLVPVRLPGCPRPCYLQLDTGAPYTVLYANALTALRTRYPAMPAARPPLADSLRDVVFGLGQGQVRAHSLRRLPTGGAHQLPANSAAPFVVGTLGTDALEGRALVLDYARRRGALYARLPDSLARRVAFGPLAFTGRRVLLEVRL